MFLQSVNQLPKVSFWKRRLCLSLCIISSFPFKGVFVITISRRYFLSVRILIFLSYEIKLRILYRQMLQAGIYLSPIRMSTSR